jgi:hypothetical protein
VSAAGVQRAPSPPTQHGWRPRNGATGLLCKRCAIALCGGGSRRGRSRRTYRATAKNQRTLLLRLLLMLSLPLVEVRRHSGVSAARVFAVLNWSGRRRGPMKRVHVSPFSKKRACRHAHLGSRSRCRCTNAKLSPPRLFPPPSERNPTVTEARERAWAAEELWRLASHTPHTATAHGSAHEPTPSAAAPPLPPPPAWPQPTQPTERG